MYRIIDDFINYVISQTKGTFPPEFYYVATLGYPGQLAHHYGQLFQPGLLYSYYEFISTKVNYNGLGTQPDYRTNYTGYCGALKSSFHPIMSPKNLLSDFCAFLASVFTRTFFLQYWFFMYF